MFAAIVCGLPAPLKAVQILWVNLLTDSLPCFALGVDPNSSSDVMNKKPRKENESVFANGGFKLIAIYSILIGLITLGSYMFPALWFLHEKNVPFSFDSFLLAYEFEDVAAKAGTYAFCVLAVSQLFHAIGMRDVKSSVFKYKWLDNKVMILALFVGLAGQLLVTEIPFLAKVFGTTQLGVVEWICILLVSTTPLIMHEILVPFQKKKQS
jgi:Ca2+-transporting ATPase